MLPEPKIIYEGRGVENLYLGMSFAEVKNILGEPEDTKYELFFLWFEDKKHGSAHYFNLGMCISFKDEKVYKFHFLSNEHSGSYTTFNGKTSKGVQLGDDWKKAINVYGDPIAEEFGIDNFTESILSGELALIGNSEIKFSIKQGKITAMYVPG